MMIPISSIPASAIAWMPKNSTGRLATGTSCLALVWVIGRRRVPRPPERIRPFRRSMGARRLVHAGELAVVPGDARLLDELECDALGRLRGDHRARVLVERAAGVALEDLAPEGCDVVGLAVDRHVGLEHDAAQDLVVDAGLDLKRRARIALEVAHLLGLRVRPRPQAPVAHDVPERHEMRAAVAAVGRADDGALLVEEGQHLVLAHLDLVAAAHAPNAT